mgnify:CR=1 FL=1
MKISPSLHLIDEAGGCNVYLVEGDDLILIDSGTPGNFEPVEKYVESIGREIEDLTHIFLTHSHVDHVSSASKIADRSGAKILAHELDSPYIRGEMGRNILMRAGDFLAGKPKFDVDIAVDGGEVIEGLEVIHTPGHTEGSVSFFYEGEGALFVGDAIRSDGGFPFGSDGNLSLSPKFFSESMGEMKASFEKIREIGPDLLLPGHGPPISEDVGRRLDELNRKIDS